MSENTVNSAFRLMGYDTKIDVCSHNGVRAAYIHLDERRLMQQWWADILDVNGEKTISPFDFKHLPG